MSQKENELNKLIARWRECVPILEQSKGAFDWGVASGYRICIDELAALTSRAPATTPTPLEDLASYVALRLPENLPLGGDRNEANRVILRLMQAASGGKEPQHDGPCYEEGMLEGLEYTAKFADKFKVEGLDLSVLAEEIRKLKCQVFPQENKEKSDG